MLTVIAQQEGYINMKDKAAQYILEFTGDERKDITIEQLVNMTFGLNWLDHKNIIKLGFLYYTKNQEKFIIKNAKLLHTPGTYHAYQSLSTQILGICLERALDKSFAAYLEEKIWQPLGLEQDAYMTLDSPKEKRTYIWWYVHHHF